MTKKRTVDHSATAARKVAQRAAARAEKRELGAVPKPTPAWKKKRAACADSLLEFCRVFLPQKFFMGFSRDHLRVIAKFERTARHGGLFAIAMPRGSGKTELSKAAALWAILYGYRRLVAVIGATNRDSVRIMRDLKSTLLHNDAINAAFPEATYAVRAAGGNPAKARAQTINGLPSGLVWNKDGVRLAFIKGAVCAGAAVGTCGLTGAIRGLTTTGPNGETVRPDMAIVDDP